MDNFDWEICEKTRNKRVYAYLLENFDKEVTEEKFLEDMSLIQRVAHAVDVDVRKYDIRSKHWKRNRLRKEYRTLKNKFGFFKAL